MTKLFERITVILAQEVKEVKKIKYIIINLITVEIQL